VTVSRALRTDSGRGAFIVSTPAKGR